MSKIFVNEIATTGNNNLIMPSGVKMPTGMILQVVSAESSGADGNDTFTSSTNFGDASHSVTITPKFSTSKVLVSLIGGRLSYGGVGGIHIRIMSSINGGSYSQVIEGVNSLTQNNTYGMNVAVQTLHSPNTTGAVIYKTQFKSSNGQTQYYTSSSCPITLTAMEVSG